MPGNKTAIFSKRIVLFDETFTPVGGKGKGRKAVAALWHEGIKGRTGKNVASSFLHCIRQHREIKNFVFSADNCSSQNKNWWLYTMLVKKANYTNGVIESIVIKYFEPGHTFMSADSSIT